MAVGFDKIGELIFLPESLIKHATHSVADNHIKVCGRSDYQYIASKFREISFNIFIKYAAMLYLIIFTAVKRAVLPAGISSRSIHPYNLLRYADIINEAADALSAGKVGAYPGLMRMGYAVVKLRGNVSKKVIGE